MLNERCRQQCYKFGEDHACACRHEEAWRSSKQRGLETCGVRHEKEVAKSFVCTLRTGGRDV